MNRDRARQTVQQNPFRTLGLLGNCSERELQRQIAIIKRYSEVGQVRKFDFDFEFIGGLSRSLDDVNLAASQVEHARKRLHYALFWFVNGSQFDEIALGYLKAENFEKAIDVWKTTLKGSVSNRNYSSLQNLSSLLIALSLKDEKLNVAHLKEGIELKGRLLQSDFVYQFSELVVGTSGVINPDEIAEYFVDELAEMVSPYLAGKDGISYKQFLSLFTSFSSAVQNSISKKFTAGPIFDIETRIEKTTRKRKDAPFDGEVLGEELYQSTKEDLARLEAILPKESIQLQLIKDKLAAEILQCAIDFFNEFIHEEDSFDPCDDALEVVQMADSIGAKGRTKNRICETDEVIQGWIDSRNENEQLSEVEDEFLFISTELNDLEDVTASIPNAHHLVTVCAPQLVRIAAVIGRSNEHYLEACDSVVNCALGIVIQVVNAKQENISSLSSFHQLESTTSEATRVILLLGSLDMRQEVRSRLNENKKTIQSVSASVKEVSDRVISAANKSSGGCYLATMVYEDYDHPQVKLLRKFRDEVLSGNPYGRGFIKLYYATSPGVVQLLKNRKSTNQTIRKILDFFINWINK